LRILGIDPALSISGYGLIETKEGKLFLLEAGVITTTSKEDTGKRLKKIYNCVNRLICETKPQVMVLEKIYAHYRHPATSFILGQARGVICLCSAINDIRLAEYAATRIKKAIVGKGLASKTQVQKMIAQIFKLERMPKYNDVTDAIALAVAHSYMTRGIK